MSSPVFVLLVVVVPLVTLLVGASVAYVFLNRNQSNGRQALELGLVDEKTFDKVVKPEGMLGR